jgi:hypothetical protein
MEQALGDDFSAVRLHDGPAAAASAQALGAAMYTSGTHIVVGGGQADPDSPAGRRALAHELHHVKQQAEGPVAGTRTHDGLMVSDPADSFERAADRTAEGIGSVPRSPAATASAQNESGGVVPGRARSSAPVVQRTLNDAITYATNNSIPGISTRRAVETYVRDLSKPADLRGGLLDAYNQGAVRQLQVTPATISSRFATLFDAFIQYLLENPEKAVEFFSSWTPKELWSFAQTSRVSRKTVQDFCIRFLPSYDDRYAFNLATQGLLLTQPPDKKYGGTHAVKPYKTHATSGYKWYQAARTGQGPIVLGALEDYQPMRDYTMYVRSEKEAANVEASARYLMAYPWSLLVNAALVTGAIHGERTIVGASDPSGKDKLFKDPYGLTVYGRELIQVVLVRKYSRGKDPVGPDLPEPATSGGLRLEPPQGTSRPTSPASIFEVEQALEAERTYETDRTASKLLSDLLNATGPMTPLLFDPSQATQADKLAKATKKKYDKLRKRLAPHHQLGVPKATLDPKVRAKLAEILKVIYPNLPADNKPVPSLPTWQVEKLENELQAIGLL